MLICDTCGESPWWSGGEYPWECHEAGERCHWCFKGTIISIDEDDEKGEDR